MKFPIMSAHSQFAIEPDGFMMTSAKLAEKPRNSLKNAVASSTGVPLAPINAPNPAWLGHPRIN